MTRQDWLAVGLKLLGAYFGVLGFAALFMMVINLVAKVLLVAPAGVAASSGGLLSVLQPIAYLFSARVLLTRTSWCLDKVGFEGKGAGKEET